MLRSAAKNWNDVGVLTSPDQYADALAEIEAEGGLRRATRFKLAVAAFNRVANYGGAISDYLSGLQLDDAHTAVAGHATFPAQANGRHEKVMDLRYGENPHQQAAVHFRVQRLDAAIHDLGETGDVADVGHGDARFAQGPGATAGGQQLHAARAQPPAQVDQAVLVGNTEQGAADGDEIGCGHGVFQRGKRHSIAV
jgi:hypothetical protein